MNIVHSYLDKQKFFEDLSFLFYRHKEKLEPFMGTINDLLETDKYALHFLKNVDDIKDGGIQSACRRVAIAWMYGVGVDYEKCFTNPSRSYISYCNNQLAVIEIQNPIQNSVLISKNGDIIVDEGIIRINGKNHYPEGWVARRIDEGKETGEEGVFSNDGKVAIPFGVFDDIHMKNDGMNTAVYKIRDRGFLEFIFHVKDIAQISTEELKGYLKQLTDLESLSEDRVMFLISPDNVIVQLIGPLNYHSNSNNLLDQVEKELKMKLKPLTKNIIQKELDQRNIQTNQ